MPLSIRASVSRELLLGEPHRLLAHLDRAPRRDQRPVRLLDRGHGVGDLARQVGGGLAFRGRRIPEAAPGRWRDSQQRLPELDPDRVS